MSLEGAEFFSELLPDHDLTRGQEIAIDPSILSLKGEPVSEEIYRLTYEIRWHENSAKDEKQDASPAGETVDKENDEKKGDEKKEAHPGAGSGTREKAETGPEAEPPETKDLDSIDESWRKTLKKLNEPAGGNRQTEETAAAEKEEAPVKCCPYSKFCLRYYRTREGDELEKIAADFSASVAKLKEINHLEDDIPQRGKMLRIP